ncbi:hypothetical protein IF2G_01370 [Cordyceps javanica]|nr:hypothetical protein IF2G_01370 [Cordyceps javanica]
MVTVRIIKATPSCLRSNCVKGDRITLGCRLDVLIQQLHLVRHVRSSLLCSDSDIDCRDSSSAAPGQLLQLAVGKFECDAGRARSSPARSLACPVWLLSFILMPCHLTSSLLIPSRTFAKAGGILHSRLERVFNENRKAIRLLSITWSLRHQIPYIIHMAGGYGGDGGGKFDNCEQPTVILLDAV